MQSDVSRGIDFDQYEVTHEITLADADANASAKSSLLRRCMLQLYLHEYASGTWQSKWTMQKVDTMLDKAAIRLTAVWKAQHDQPEVSTVNASESDSVLQEAAAGTAQPDVSSIDASSLVGFGILTGSDASNALLEDVIVHPLHRGKRLGSFICHDLIQWCKQHPRQMAQQSPAAADSSAASASSGTLSIYCRSELIAFYEQLGLKLQRHGGADSKSYMVMQL